MKVLIDREAADPHIAAYKFVQLMKPYSSNSLKKRKKWSKKDRVLAVMNGCNWLSETDESRDKGFPAEEI